MPLDINEADWKILKTFTPLALASAKERSAKSNEPRETVPEITTSTTSMPSISCSECSQHLESPLCQCDDLRCSRALTMPAQMRSEGLLAEEAFASFSQETRGAVEMLLGAR